jgi:hypothetical protein
MSDPVWIRKECLMALEVLNRMISEGDYSTEDLVDVGSVLWDIGRRSNQLLEKIKPLIREAALEQAEGMEGKVELSGHQRKCLVTVVPAQFKLSKKADIQALRDALGSQFPEYFRDTPTLDPEFEKKFSRASVEEKSTLLGSVVQQDSTPRVSFKPRKK